MQQISSLYIMRCDNVIGISIQIVVPSPPSYETSRIDINSYKALWTAYVDGKKSQSCIVKKYYLGAASHICMVYNMLIAYHFPILKYCILVLSLPYSLYSYHLLVCMLFVMKRESVHLLELVEELVHFSASLSMLQNQLNKLLKQQRRIQTCGIRAIY